MTPVNLGDISSLGPLRSGDVRRNIGGAGGTMAWPAAENYFYFGAGATTNPCIQGQICLPTRFWWVVGACFIEWTNASWTRFDTQLRLVNAAGTPINDLNGISWFQKAYSSEGTGHADGWIGFDIEAKFYCEANTVYNVQFLSKNTPANCNYYQAVDHLNMWSYTVGEGAY